MKDIRLAGEQAKDVDTISNSSKKVLESQRMDNNVVVITIPKTVLSDIFRISGRCEKNQHVIYADESADNEPLI